MSFAIWKLWKSTGYQMNLYGGKGIMEWPDWLLDDLTVFSWLNTMIRRDMGLDAN